MEKEFVCFDGVKSATFHIDPLGQPTVQPVVIIIFPHVSVRSSPLFKILQQNKHHMKIMIATGRTVSLVEGIIYETCLGIFFAMVIWL